MGYTREPHQEPQPGGRGNLKDLVGWLSTDLRYWDQAQIRWLMILKTCHSMNDPPSPRHWHDTVVWNPHNSRKRREPGIDCDFLFLIPQQNNIFKELNRVVVNRYSFQHWGCRLSSVMGLIIYLNFPFAHPPSIPHVAYFLVVSPISVKIWCRKMNW